MELGRDPATRKRKRLKRAFRGSKREAEKEMARLLHELETGTYVEPKKLTFGEYLSKWLEDYGRARLAASTFRRYNQIIHGRVIPQLGQIPLNKLKPLHLQEFYTRLVTGERMDGKKGKLSPASIIYHHRVIHKALNTALKQQLVNRNVADAVELPKENVGERSIDDSQVDNNENIRVLTEKQVSRMLEAARETPYYTLLYLAIRTGMRRGELLGLRWKDIDFDKAMIYVRQTLLYTPEKGLYFKPPKTKKSRRNIDITAEVLEVLRQHKKKQAQNKLLLGQAYEDYNLVFCQANGRPIHPDTPSSWFPNFLESIGLPKLNFHCLRHTHASLLLKAGVDIKVISERLGHSSIRITYDIYSHLMPGMQSEAAQKLEDLLTK